MSSREPDIDILLPEYVVILKTVVRVKFWSSEAGTKVLGEKSTIAMSRRLIVLQGFSLSTIFPSGPAVPG